jgi:hypothetical protein
MRGLRLDFKDSGKVSINFRTSIDDFDSTIQNAVVNVVTEKNSDSTYSKRGTSLKKDLLSGGMLTNNMYHICNFSAADTTTFTNVTSTSLEKIATLRLVPSIESDTLVIKVHSESSEGTTSSLTWSI